MTCRLRCLAALLIAAGGGLARAAPAPPAGAPQSASLPIPYFIANGVGKRGFRATDPELARWALEAWQRSADGLRFTPAREEEDALLRVYWIEPKDGRYGEAQPLTLGDRRGAAVYIRPDTDGLGVIGSLAARDPLLRESIVYLTCLHESGHALGLTHTRDFADIMFSFEHGGDLSLYFGRYRAQLRARADIASVSGLSPGDVTQLRARLAAR